MDDYGIEPGKPARVAINDTPLVLGSPFTWLLTPGAYPYTTTLYVDDKATNQIWQEALLPTYLDFEYYSYEPEEVKHAGRIEGLYLLERRYDDRQYAGLFISDCRFKGNYPFTWLVCP